MLKIKFFVISMLLIFAILIFFAIKANSNQEINFCMKKSYEYYKKKFITKDGRIMDPEKNNITTSEGQAYMLYRAVVANDRKTIDLAYKWTKNNIQRKDKLFAWLWGENKQGEYKILDYNSASDADINIAFALLKAYNEWDDSTYLHEAIPIVQTIWDKETKVINNRLVLMPGVDQSSSSKIEVNPSYFSPYAFRVFQKYDDLHDWNRVIDSSYYYITASSAKTKTGLPPNWFLIEDGQIVLENSPRSDFSYDAIRVFQNIYLDSVRTGEKKALPILAKSKFFIEKWQHSGSYIGPFYTNYKADGQLRDTDQFIGSIAILLPPISMYDQKLAREIYDKAIKPYYQNKSNWLTKKDYYGKNLLWFGCYLYNKNSKEYKEMQKIRVKILYN